MQSVSARIWTRVAVSIPYNDNHYTTGTSFYGISTIVGYLIPKQFLYVIQFSISIEFKS